MFHFFVAALLPSGAAPPVLRAIPWSRYAADTIAPWRLSDSREKSKRRSFNPISTSFDSGMTRVTVTTWPGCNV
jgi:hypothetical protein